MSYFYQIQDYQGLNKTAFKILRTYKKIQIDFKLSHLVGELALTARDHDWGNLIFPSIVSTFGRTSPKSFSCPVYLHHTAQGYYAGFVPKMLTSLVG